MAPRLRPLLAALALGLAVNVVGCGEADVDERDRGADIDGGDSYDPEDLDEREENK